MLAEKSIIYEEEYKNKEILKCLTGSEKLYTRMWTQRNHVDLAKELPGETNENRKYGRSTLSKTLA